jgi:hypothetical protein
MAKIINFPANKIEKGTHIHYPEMGERKVACELEARLAYGGNHYFVISPEELKGRGITFVNTYQESDFVKPNNPRVGYHRYRVTMKAFEKLEANYSISMEALLD